MLYLVEVAWGDPLASVTDCSREQGGWRTLGTIDAEEKPHLPGARFTRLARVAMSGVAKAVAAESARQQRILDELEGGAEANEVTRRLLGELFGAAK